MDKRRAKRNQIQVDIEIARPGASRCCGYAENISRTGVAVVLTEGRLPTRQRSVILNFKVWTGRETLYRKIHARVVRPEPGKVALEFTRHNFTAESIIKDLMYYQRDNAKTSRSQGKPSRLIPARSTA